MQISIFMQIFIFVQISIFVQGFSVLGYFRGAGGAFGRPLLFLSRVVVEKIAVEKED